MTSLAGRRVLVTGGSRGVGLAVARELLARGAAVMIAARDRTGLAQAREELAPVGNVAVQCCDVVSPTDIAATVAATIAGFGGMDGVVNSAGIGPRAASFTDLQDDDFRVSFEINVLGSVRVLRAALPEIRRHPHSAIVNVASMAGKVGVPMWAEYCASKHALLGLTKSIAREYAADGLRCNAVCPGFAQGGLLSSQLLQRWAESLGVERRELERDVIKKRTPTGRLVDLRSIAGTVAFLLGSDALDVTGQAFNVCGGIGDA